MNDIKNLIRENMYLYARRWNADTEQTVVVQITNFQNHLWATYHRANEYDDTMRLLPGVMRAHPVNSAIFPLRIGGGNPADIRYDVDEAMAQITPQMLGRIS